jgi:AcrR family transcriptional regulator
MSVEMEPLPRGRHSLSREEVEGSQRERLQRAMAEAMAEKGYALTSVADILRRARVSRETFYELYSSKEDCFMSVFDAAYAAIGAAMTASSGTADPATTTEPLLARVLDDYLGAIATDPVTARVFLIEVYAAGPEAIERRTALQQGLVDLLAQGLGGDERDRFAVEAGIAAIAALVTARLAVGDVDGIRALRDPILDLLTRLGLGIGRSL